MRIYFLKKLLNTSSVTQIEFDEAMIKYGLSLTYNKSFVVCLLKIDDYKDFIEKRSQQERDLLRFAVTNVGIELIASKYAVEAVDMKNDHIALIINVEPGMEELDDELYAMIRRTQQFVAQNYKLSLSAALSVKTARFQDLYSAYHQALNTSLYRFVYGKMSLLSAANIQQNHNSIPVEEVLQTELLFVESVKRGDLHASSSNLTAFMEKIIYLEYSDLILALMHFANQLKHTISDLNHSRVQPVNTSSILLSRDLLEMETIEEFRQRIDELLQGMNTGAHDDGFVQDAVTADTIKAIIEANYMNTNIGASEIAAMMGISVSKVGKLFKQHTQMTIPEYMNHTRLTKAVEWMENSKLSISEIMRKVGVENESYFYKMFKAKYSQTPREYIAQKAKERM